MLTNDILLKLPESSFLSAADIHPKWQRVELPNSCKPQMRRSTSAAIQEEADLPASAKTDNLASLSAGTALPPTPADVGASSDPAEQDQFDALKPASQKLSNRQETSATTALDPAGAGRESEGAAADEAGSKPVAGEQHLAVALHEEPEWVVGMLILSAACPTPMTILACECDPFSLNPSVSLLLMRLRKFQHSGLIWVPYFRA